MALTSNQNGVDIVNKIIYNPDAVVSIAKKKKTHSIPWSISSENMFTNNNNHLSSLNKNNCANLFD